MLAKTHARIQLLASLIALSGCSDLNEGGSFAARQPTKVQTEQSSNAEAAETLDADKPEVKDESGDTVDQDPDTDDSPPVVHTVTFNSTPITTMKFGDPIGNPSEFDFADWQVIDFARTQGNSIAASNWVIADQKVTQTINADASIFLSNLDSTSQKIVGTWSTGQANDDDFMGFVFGYQDRSHFYLFDWKKGPQALAGALAKVGMTIKKVAADTELGSADLWASKGVAGRVTPLFSNDIAWQADRQYAFELNFAPGSINIIIRLDGDVIATLDVADSTYEGGKFGFYNFSQGNMTYDGFKYTPIQGLDYSYQAQATSSDPGDILTYSLSVSPPGMSIDSQSGLISWAKDLLVAGTHPVTVVVVGTSGATATQSFVIK